MQLQICCFWSPQLGLDFLTPTPPRITRNLEIKEQVSQVLNPKLENPCNIILMSIILVVLCYFRWRCIHFPDQLVQKIPRIQVSRLLHSRRKLCRYQYHNWQLLQSYKKHTKILLKDHTFDCVKIQLSPTLAMHGSLVYSGRPLLTVLLLTLLQDITFQSLQTPLSRETKRQTPPWWSNSKE